MSIVFLLLFVAVLLGFVIADISIVYALLIGFVIFFVYALKNGFGVIEVFKMSASGIISAKNVLINFLLIGLLTALWRASGTISSIVSYSIQIMNPSFMVVLTFLLCSLISFLTGTAFGTSATIGVICMNVSVAMGINPIFIGGAVVSGAYFGDRCSPVSTSALLISELTRTNLYDNIKKMLKTAIVPFLLSCLIFTMLGFLTPSQNTNFNVGSIFENEFRLGWLPLIPAVLIVILSLARLNVKITMLSSIAASVLICIFYQNQSVTEILTFAVAGYKASTPAAAEMINGGGIVSMLRVSAIVCISSSYSGIFHKTDILKSLEAVINKLHTKISTFAVVLITALASATIACNQTLAIMLTQQLCSKIEADKKRLAIFLENSAVVVSSLVPWSIACRVPLDSVGAPVWSISLAALNILIPLWSLWLWRKKKEKT